MTGPRGGRGVFVSFEGVDGAGKSTQVALAEDWLRSLGHDVLVTREPGGTELGRRIRGLLLHGGDVDARTEALLYAADRAHHVATVVGPHVERGGVVVADRYIDSSVAYQGAARALGTEEIRALSEWATGGLWPDVTVLLDVTPATAARRRSGAADRLERSGEVFYERVRAQYRAIADAEPGRVVLLDADAEPAAVHESVRAALARHLGLVP